MIRRLIDWLDWVFKISWTLVDVDFNYTDTPVAEGVILVETARNRVWFNVHTKEKRPASPRFFRYYTYPK